MVVALIALPVVLHGIGATAFGLWVILQTFSAVSGWFSIADLGIGTAATSAIAGASSREDSDLVRTLIGTTLVIFAAMGIVAALLLVSIGPLVLPTLFHAPHRMIGVFRVAIIAIAIQTAADLLTEGIEACLEGLQRVDMSRAVDANRRTVVAAGTSVAAAVTGNLGWVAVAACGASLFSLLIALFTLTHHGGHLLAGFDRAEARSLLRYGRTVALLRPLGVIQRTTDRVIVGIILGPGSVALVEVATQVLNGADAILSATSYAVVPSASWLRARQDEPQLRELFLRGTLYSVLATWIVCAAAAGLAGPFVHIWVGARFSRAPTFIAVALAGEVIAAPCQVGSNLLLGTGRAHKILSAAVLTLAVNLIASVFLVEMVGVVGTFLGTSIANVFLLPTLLRTALQETKTTPRRFFRQSIATIILPAAVIAASGWAVSRLPISPVPMLATGVAACLIAGTIVTMLSPSLRGDMSDVLGALRRRSN